MKIILNIILVVLVLLAVSSGVTKILLMQQDVEFFGQYGFTNPVLIAYGVIQLMGGLLLVFPKTRIAGAIVVAVTFLISLVILIMAGNMPVAVITLVCIILLGLVIRQALNTKEPLI